MRLGSMPGIWLINEGLIPFGVLWANSGGAAEASENQIFRERHLKSKGTRIDQCSAIGSLP
jgi:hypothetical protein